MCFHRCISFKVKNQIGNILTKLKDNDQNDYVLIFMMISKDNSLLVKNSFILDNFHKKCIGIHAGKNSIAITNTGRRVSKVLGTIAALII